MPRPRRLLADVHPELDEIYHPDNPVPFDEVPLNASDKFLWRCRHGHVWEETASSRRSLKLTWKAAAGGALACPWCERLWVKLACGHVRRCNPGEQVDDTEPCWSCRRAAVPEAQAAAREREYWAHADEVLRAAAELEGICRRSTDCTCSSERSGTGA